MNDTQHIVSLGEFFVINYKFFAQAVKPRRCGRAFGKFCDLDDDDRLTLTEWNDCFSKDEINREC